jgi:hypothetical protein
MSLNPLINLIPEKSSSNLNENQIKNNFKFAEKPQNNSMLPKDWKEIKIVTNFLRVNFNQTDKKVWEYSIVFINTNFNEDDQKKKAIKLLLPKIREKYNHFKLSGNNFFSLTYINEDIEFSVIILDIEVKCIIKNTNHFIDLKNVNQNDKQFNKDIKCFFEKVIKHIIMSNNKMLKIKDDYYDLKKMKKIDEKSYLISGFKTSFRHVECGFLYLVNIKNKFINAENCLDKLRELRTKYMNEGGQEFHYQAQIYFKELTIITQYGNPRTYRLKGVNFDKNITNTTIKINKTSEEITLLQYYEKNYPDQKITQKNQPLLIVENKMSDGTLQEIYLIPELCKLTGMDDRSTEAKSNMMKGTRMRPNERMELTMDFTKLINNQEKKTKKINGEIKNMDAPKNIADNWGIKFDDFKVTTARIMPPPTINFASIIFSLNFFFNIYKKIFRSKRKSRRENPI